MGQIILLLIAVIGIVGYVVMKKIGKIDIGSQAHLT
jgi:uncharacterized membrane protein (DUF4010 family)